MSAVVTSSTVRIIGRALHPETTAFFLCDFQECFRTAAPNFAQVLEVARRLVEGAKLLSVPLIVTEQYPKGLGHTSKELDLTLAVGVYEKTQFTMLVPEVRNVLKTLMSEKSVNSAVLFGLETHVCVLQTALDMLAAGLTVHVVADACTSRSRTDRKFALDRLLQAGCVITTYETVLMQLIGGKDHPQFKAVSGLIKLQPEDTGLLSPRL